MLFSALLDRKQIDAHFTTSGVTGHRTCFSLSDT